MKSLVRPVLCAATFVAAMATVAPGSLHAQETAPGIETIRQSDLSADLHFLAGDELRGRLAGSPEGRVASAFIKSRFRRLGLVPVGPGGTYYHYFNVAQTEVGEDNRLRVADGSVTLPC